MYILYSIVADIEYWKVPSRRFYVATRTEFQNLRKNKGRAMTLSRKRKRVDSDGEDEEEGVTLSHIAQELEKVCNCYLVIANVSHDTYALTLGYQGSCWSKV